MPDDAEWAKEHFQETFDLADDLGLDARQRRWPVVHALVRLDGGLQGWETPEWDEYLRVIAVWSGRRGRRRRSLAAARRGKARTHYRWGRTPSILIARDIWGRRVA